MAGIQYSELLTAVLARLSGRGNAYTTDQLISYINEGKDELWKALVATSDDYFVQTSQSTDATKPAYFAALNINTRTYTLPSDCLRPRRIAVNSPSGFENTQFIYRKIWHPDFVDQQNQSTATGPSGSSTSFITSPQVYYYTIIGKNTLILARFPEVAFNLTLYYVRSLPDGGQSSTLDETALPFKSDIINFAVVRASAVSKDTGAWGIWKDSWVKGIVATVQAAGPRSEGNALYAAEAEY